MDNMNNTYTPSSSKITMTPEAIKKLVNNIVSVVLEGTTIGYPRRETSIPGKHNHESFMEYRPAHFKTPERMTNPTINQGIRQGVISNGNNQKQKLTEIGTINPICCNFTNAQDCYHYIGCYISSGETNTIGNPNRDKMVMRKVEIQNLNRNSVELTLWDDLAETFKKEEIDKLEKAVIIAVSSCLVSKYYNKLQLSSTPATYYYINPRIPQLEQYQAEYRDLFNLNPPLEIVRFPLAVLLTQTPKTYEGVRFTCEGNITSIHTSKDWYYPSYTTCILKVQENDGVFDCRVHGPLEYPSYRATTYPTAEQHDTGPDISKSTTAKRALFQEKAADTKKNKKE
ncbi:replication protein A 70 kDa DNA-binding subunit [Artemisia annua]|uniref:Replication protein A 70 kDa DNA-binding subunit n=1 Tax=Artemisia annua TaxID=35608 RepID=A0A2U1LNE2_ARTAN|nr:replication protein A 70 kDa DNA-binding subunit [Artemisia annua]